MNVIMNLLKRFAYVPEDSEETRFHKILILIVSLVCSVCGLIWSLMYYWFLGPCVTMAIPLAFIVLIGGAIPLAHWCKNHHLLVYAQLAGITWLSAFIEWSLGDIHDSGLVIIWSLLGAVGALLFLGKRQPLIWMGMFLVIAVITIVVQPRWTMDAERLSDTGRVVFYLMNLCIPACVIFATVRYFVNTNKENLKKLQATYTKLITSEKLAALGQVAAGVAHEVNTPLGAIKSSAEESTRAYGDIMESLGWLSTALSPKQMALYVAFLRNATPMMASLSTKEEREIRRLLRERFSELGLENGQFVSDRLVQAGIYTVGPELEALSALPEFERLVVLSYHILNQQRSNLTIQLAVDKASRVVKALKTYLQGASGNELVAINLCDNLDVVLTIYQNRLKQGVRVVKHYGEVPLVMGYPDQLNQVWTNLIVNALQAMDNQGVLTIGLKMVKGAVEVTIGDTGKGIPPEVQTRIFEPFFTTKRSGEGSGLGLHIVRQIVEEHGATISFSSVPGEGTTFTVLLPSLG